MVLSKKDILARIKTGEIAFSPDIDGFQLQPHAIDLRLGYNFHIPKTWEITKDGRKAITIDPLDAQKNGKNFDEIKLRPGQYFELLPEELVIATTLERIELNGQDVMCVLYPRSSINRRGLSVDLSGIIDVGYKGNLMIPIVNKTQKQVIRIYPGERICQVMFQQISSKISSGEAAVHGLTKAKYGSGNGFIGSKSDREDELKLIKLGKVEQIKRKYKVKSNY
jgi:deoxycytidine triphosphate deaminase